MSKSKSGTLHGKRILLDRPVLKEMAVKLPPEAEESFMNKELKKWTKLNIYQVGSEVEKFKAGDKVYVYTRAIEHAELIVINEETKILIHQDDIVYTW